MKNVHSLKTILNNFIDNCRIWYSLLKLRKWQEERTLLPIICTWVIRAYQRYWKNYLIQMNSFYFQMYIEIGIWSYSLSSYQGIKKLLVLFRIFIIWISKWDNANKTIEVNKKVIKSPGIWSKSRVHLKMLKHSLCHFS